MQNYKQMSEEDFDRLMQDVEANEMGEECVYACNASAHDHLHVRRIGSEHTSYGRLGVFSHGPTGMVTLFLSPADARSLAETLMTIAEEIDGDPVSFDAIPDDLSALNIAPQTDDEDSDEG